MQSISEYPATKPKKKVDEQNNKFAYVKNLNVLNTNTEEYLNVPSTQNVTSKHLQNKNESINSQNSNGKNILDLQKTKTEETGQSGYMKPITEQSSSSTNDYNFNFDSAQFSSLGEITQNQNNASNNYEKFGIENNQNDALYNFGNLGVEIPNSQADFNNRNEENYYLSNEDLVNISSDMNVNSNLNINDNFEKKNSTNQDTKKDEKNPFEINEMLINELIDTNNVNNQISKNEGGYNFSEYATTKNDDHSNHSNQSQLPLKEKELNNIQTTSTTNIYNDYFKNDSNYNFNMESIQGTSSFQNDLKNINQHSMANINIEYNQLASNELKQEKKVETRDSSTQTQSSDAPLNLSPKVSPFETKLQNINMSQTVSKIGTNIPSKNSNFQNDNKKGEQNQNIAFPEFIDTSSTPDYQNQNIGLSEYVDLYSLEMPSTIESASKTKGSEKKTENTPNNETIPKSEPEFNFDNIPIETQDNNTFVEQNVKNENTPSPTKENNDKLNSFLKSSDNKDLNFAKIYEIAENAILEDNASSNIIALETKNQLSTDEKQKQIDYSSLPLTENQISSLGTELFSQSNTESKNTVDTKTTTTTIKKELTKPSITTPLETNFFTQYTSEPTKTVKTTQKETTFSSNSTPFKIDDFIAQYTTEPTKTVTTTKEENQIHEITTNFDTLAAELVEDYTTEPTTTINTTINKIQKSSNTTNITPLENDLYSQFSSKPFPTVSTTKNEINNSIPKETDYLKQLESQPIKTVTTTTITETPKPSITTSKSEQIAQFTSEELKTINKNTATNSFGFESDYLNLLTEPNQAITDNFTTNMALTKTSDLPQITTQQNQTVTTNLTPIETQNLTTFNQAITPTIIPSLTINETIPSNIIPTTETQNTNLNFDLASILSSQTLNQTSLTDIFPLESQNQTVQPLSTLTQIQTPVTNILQTPDTNISTNYIIEPIQTIQSQVPFIENQNTTNPTYILPVESQTQNLYLPPIIPTGNIPSSLTQTTETSIFPPNDIIYTPQPNINITTPVSLPEAQIQTIPTNIQNIPPLQSQLPNVYLPPVYQNNQTQYPMPQNEVSNISINAFPLESQIQNILIPPSIPTYSPNPITNISTNDIPIGEQTQNILLPQVIPTPTTFSPNPITTTSTSVNSFEMQNYSFVNNTLPISQNLINSTENYSTYDPLTDNNIINYTQQPQPQPQIQPDYSTYPLTQASNINISNTQNIPGSSNIPNNYRTQTEIVPVEEIKYVPVKTVKYVKRTKVFVPKIQQVIVPIQNTVYESNNPGSQINNAASLTNYGTTPLETIPEYSSMSYQNPKPNLPLSSAALPYSSNTEYDNEMEDSAIPIYESNSSFQLGQSLNALGTSTTTIYNQSSVPNVGSSFIPPTRSSFIHTGRIYNPRTYLARSLSSKRRL